MAKHTYESVFSELRKGVFHPVYYFMGEEAFFIDRLTDCFLWVGCEHGDYCQLCEKLSHDGGKAGGDCKGGAAYQGD